jgi:hypothetical protein
MNYVALLKKGQKLRYFRISSFLMLVLISLFLSACEKKDENDAGIVKRTEEQIIADFARAHYHGSEVKLMTGEFKVRELNLTAVILEENSGTEFGIRFLLVHLAADSVIVDYVSNILDGSVTDAVIEKVRLSGSNYEQLYYYSAGYFMGSGGGEAFAYVIDFNLSKVSMAHVYISRDKSPKLFISATVQNKEVREFFIKKFRADFPDLELVSRDYKFVE